MPSTVERCELIAPPAADLAERVVGDVLRRAARLGGGDPLVRAVTPAGDVVWTADELLVDAERVARWLLARHSPGTRVATCLANGPEAVLLQLGVALAGMVLVPVNPRVRPPELEHALRLSGAACIDAATEVAGNPIAAVAEELAPRLPAPLAVHSCAGDWQALLAGGDAGHPLPDVDPDDLA